MRISAHKYAADGNRVSAGSEHFVYDDYGHLLSDDTNTYVYGGSGVVGYYGKDGKFVTYLFNQRGDVIKEVDESGSVINSFDYNDYGCGAFFFDKRHELAQLPSV